VVPEKLIIQDKKGKQKTVYIEKDAKPDGKNRKQSMLSTMANAPAEYSRMGSTLSHISDAGDVHPDDQHAMKQANMREDAARSMLQKIQTFDESDVGMPSYAADGWARCSVLRQKIALSRMPLSFTPLLRLKLLHACDQ
jgi:hypothetical protein